MYQMQGHQRYEIKQKFTFEIIWGYVAQILFRQSQSFNLVVDEEFQNHAHQEETFNYYNNDIFAWKQLIYPKCSYREV